MRYANLTSTSVWGVKLQCDDWSQRGSERGLCSVGCAQNLPEQRVVKISVLAPAKSDVLTEGYKNELTVVHRLGSGLSRLRVSAFSFTVKYTEV